MTGLGIGNPSRSTQPVVSAHRAGVPRVTRSLDSPRGSPDDTGTCAVMLSCSLCCRCLMLAPSFASVGALTGRASGEHDRLDHAKRGVGIAGERVVDRLQTALYAV